MLTALYTAEQAHVAAMARREHRWDDPELKKLGEISVSLDLDLQRIYAQTERVAEYINFTRRYVAAHGPNDQPGSEEFRTVHDRLEQTWARLSPPEENALQSMDLSWFVEHPDADYAILAAIPPIFRQQYLIAGKEDPYQPVTRRLFEDGSISSKRSVSEARAIRLIHEAYDVMSCNDPSQPLVAQLKSFLRDFGVPFEDQQVFHGEQD